MSVDEYIYSQPEEIHEILFSVRNIMATTHMKFSKSQDTLRQMSHLYGEGGIWVRPAAMWNEIISREGKTFRRFEKD